MALTIAERTERDDLFKLGLKRCGKCGVAKMLKAFNANRSTRDGRESSCKACRKRYRAEHKKEIATKNRRYHIENKERLNAASRQYNTKHKERISIQSRQYRAEHRDEITAYLTEHKERIAARQRQYRLEHKDKLDAHYRQYRATPRGKALGRARRIRRRAYPGGQALTAAMIREIIDYQHDTCPYCGFPIGNGHIDHILPVSRGGTNARDNLVYCCATCNLSKGSKTLSEWRYV